jgi:hypothetical protein
MKSGWNRAILQLLIEKFREPASGSQCRLVESYGMEEHMVHVILGTYFEYSLHFKLSPDLRPPGS